MCGSGLSPDHADSLSHRLAYVRRSCRRNSCRSVAVAGAQKSSLGENHGTGLAVFPPNAVSLLPEPLLKKISSPVKPEHWRYHTHHGTESGHETVPEEHSSPIQRRTLPSHTFPPAYALSIGHKKWNLLRKIEHGNTSSAPIKVASALRAGHEIAVWWQEPDPANSRWYTAKILKSIVEKGVLEHEVLYNSDKSRTWKVGNTASCPGATR